MRKALERNKTAKRNKGGSTITQQTAKNVFLWPGRTYVRKGLEAWFTVLIEALWTKERILEVYLNIAEMGKGVFGAEAAAQRCFNRPASKLTKEQCALITATLPYPGATIVRSLHPMSGDDSSGCCARCATLGMFLTPRSWRAAASPLKWRRNARPSAKSGGKHATRRI